MAPVKPSSWSFVCAALVLGAGQARAAPRQAAQAPPTVFLIVMENVDWSTIKGNASADFINEKLLPVAAHAESYFNPRGLHPSEPNYIWLEAGDNLAITTNDPPAKNHRATSKHLVAQLSQAGISWKSYQEGIDGTRCPLTDRGTYVPRHNPFVYFDDVTDSNDPQSRNCIAHVRPYAELERDLIAGTVARYNFITPDICHDMHDRCPPRFDRIYQGDDWLEDELPKILESRVYRESGIVFITWDEGAGGSDGPIGLLLLSPFAKRGYSNARHYTHSSLLRTLQEIFGVGPLLGDAANATDLRDLFAVFPAARP